MPVDVSVLVRSCSGSVVSDAGRCTCYLHRHGCTHWVQSHYHQGGFRIVVGFVAISGIVAAHTKATLQPKYTESRPRCRCSVEETR